jgi:CubicO group peptidase (beta-lactamase class C family)
MSEEVSIEGFCAARFEPLRSAFRESFAKGEVGASVAVVLDGEPVVDLWGGHVDLERTRPWQRDTLVNVYSTTKGMTALCAHRLVEEGRLDLDAPVARYWPEFAQSGKERIPVRDLLCHRSGVAAFPRAVRAAEQLLEWKALCGLLAAQQPLWEPGTRHGYHAVTFGHLVGEVVRRIDGRSLGSYFREEIATPLGVDFHIGLPESEHARCAELIQSRERRGMVSGGFASRMAALGERLDDGLEQGEKRAIYARAQQVFGWGPSVRLTNTREWRLAEIPAANGHGNARSVARVYGALARGGELDGVRVLSASAVAGANTEHSFGPDGVLFGLRTRFGLGYFMTHPGVPFGPNPRAFGHPGAGGSVGFADPDARLGFGYAMNQMQGTIFAGSHGFALIEAAYRCLG